MHFFITFSCAEKKHVSIGKIYLLSFGKSIMMSYFITTTLISTFKDFQ